MKTVSSSFMERGNVDVDTVNPAGMRQVQVSAHVYGDGSGWLILRRLRRGMVLERKDAIW